MSRLSHASWTDDVGPPRPIVGVARRQVADGPVATPPDTVLRELQLREAALDAAPNGIAIIDARGPDLPIVYVNAGFERLTGYPADEALGRSHRFLQGAAPDPVAEARLGEAVQGERAVTIRVRSFCKDGRPFWNQISFSPVRTAGTVTHYLSVQLDVTEQVAAEEQARHLAHADPLTGLWNRRALREHLERACRPGREVALLHLDLDRFRAVNEARGHSVGDALLLEVAERLQAAASADAFLARHGSDEFAVVIEEPGAAEAGLEIADAALVSLRASVLFGGEPIDARASVGLSVFPHDADSPAALLMHADAAMREAKLAGGDARRAFDGGRLGLAPLLRPTTAPPRVRGPGADGPRVLGADLEALLAGDALRSLYQPLVRLDGTRLVGYEALARGPEGSRLESPEVLFAAARERGLLLELEWACRATALRGALDAGLDRAVSLFVNAEPSTLAAPVPEHLVELVGRSAERMDVVIELTERALTDRPGEVLAAVPRLRRHGFAIALDDVGADPRSVALMPFLRPDVIKLDMHLVQGRPSAARASVVHAVRAEVERTGAWLIAEGIETAEHERTAIALGAEVGQGWAFGRPEPLSAVDLSEARPLQIALSDAAPGDGVDETGDRDRGPTAYEIVSAHVAPREGVKRLLLSFSQHLEAQVTARSESAVLLATFQDAHHFTRATRARYARLGQSAAFVGALGTDLPLDPVPGVRGAHLRPDELLRREWDIVVVDPYFAAAFVAREIGDGRGPDKDRRFRFCMTYDRELAVEAARSLMRRITPHEPSDGRG